MDLFNLEFLIIISLASFRLTRLIVFDKITRWLRRPFLKEETVINNGVEELVKSVIQGSRLRMFIGELLRCYWCVGVWISSLLILLIYYSEVYGKIIILIFAVSGLSCIVESIVQKLILKK